MSPSNSKSRTVALQCSAFSDEAVRLEITETIFSQFGRLDILVNNAGIAPEIRKDMLDLTEGDLSSLMKVNLFAPFLLIPLRCHRRSIVFPRQGFP